MTTDPQLNEAAARRLAASLTDIVSQQASHQTGLQALLFAYAAVAMCHPCCAHGAAIAARAAADLIEANTAPQDAQRPSSAVTRSGIGCNALLDLICTRRA